MNQSFTTETGNEKKWTPPTHVSVSFLIWLKVGCVVACSDKKVAVLNEGIR